KMIDQLAGVAQDGEYLIEIVQRDGDPGLLQPDQDLVDGRRVGPKDLLQELERRARSRELVAVDATSRHRQTGVGRAQVAAEAERAGRLQGRRRLTFGF